MRTFSKISFTKGYQSFYLAESISSVRTEEVRPQESVRADLVLKIAGVKKRQKHAEIDREEERKERIQGED